MYTRAHIHVREVYVEDIRISDFLGGGKDGCILVSLFSVRTNLPPSAPLSSSLPKRFIRTKAGNTDADGNIQAAFLRIGPSLCENAKWSPGVPLSVGYAIA